MTINEAVIKVREAAETWNCLALRYNELKKIQWKTNEDLQVVERDLKKAQDALELAKGDMANAIAGRVLQNGHIGLFV